MKQSFENTKKYANPSNGVNYLKGSDKNVSCQHYCQITLTLTVHIRKPYPQKYLRGTLKF